MLDNKSTQEEDNNLSRGYLKELNNDHVDFLVNLNPTKLLTQLRESEPEFIELIMSTFQKMYPAKDIQALIEQFLSQTQSPDAFHMAMQKAFVDGAVVAYLMDHLAQTNVHKGTETVNDLIDKVKTLLTNEDNKHLSEEELRIKNMYTNESEPIKGETF